MEDYFVRYYDQKGARKRPFGVVSLGYDRCAARLDYAGFLRKHPERHRFSKDGRTLETLVLVHITAGHGFFRSAKTDELPIPANSIFFVFPGVNHFYRYAPETGWNEEWIELDPRDVLPLLAETGITAENPIRTFPFATSVSEAFQNLFDAAAAEHRGSPWLVDAAAHRVVAETLTLWQKGSADPSAARAVEVMRQALVSDLTDASRVADAARLAGMSASRMRDLFKRATGLSPKKYQMRARLVRAGRLLRETDLSVAAIAEQTGFESLFAFSHRFSKFVGLSPTAYRQKRLRHSLVLGKQRPLDDAGEKDK